MADAFAPLPRALTSGGAPRRTGVEIEFAGLTEDEAAAVVIDELGGAVTDRTPFALTVTGTRIGAVDLLLDTALRKYGGESAVIEAGLDAARIVVPVELVSEPLDLEGLSLLDGARDALHRAGATGTGDGALLGFGVHLNVEVVSADDPFTVATVLAFGLVEDWLRRAAAPIDPTRRILPFVDPWPRRFVSDLIEAGPSAGLDRLHALYAQHVSTRNHALDLLPLLKSANPDAFARDFGDAGATKARPAYHYRLPDCRIDDPDWSLAVEWDSWRAVERIADRPELLARLCTAWRDRPVTLVSDRQDWAETVRKILAGAKPPLIVG
jgi:hypothetical protein